MDYDFITQLYFGNITPSVRGIPENSALGKASKTFSDAEEILTKALTGAEKHALLELLNAHSEIICNEGYDNFCQGFRLGALAILDILAGADKLFQDD